MYLTDKENNGFTDLVKFINEKYDDKTILDLKFTLVYDDKTITAKYDTMFETDNGLYDQADYEEYNAIAFLDLGTGELFEINYKNLPKTILCENHKIL